MARVSIDRLGVLVVLLAACQPRTEVVVGLISDMRVPVPLAVVTLAATREGVPVDQRSWPDVGTPLQLPGSYGFYSGDGSAPPITILVEGFHPGASSPFITRAADLTLGAGQTLFLRLSLVSACSGMSCAGGTTCIEGTCATTVVDNRTLPLYREELVSILQCASGPAYVASDTGSALPVAGACNPGQTCRDGICYPAAR